MGYQWNWGVFLQPSAAGDDTYLGWMFAGLKMTITLSLSAWVIALLLGAIVGVLRTAPNKVLAGLATAYVELFRNIPLLVQLFIWYFVLPELLPKAMGDAFKQSNPVFQMFSASMICLGLFTSARVAEQVRAGINSLPKGQKNAGLALGFTLPQTYRHIVLPQAFRVILPPMSSELTNCFKNASVASLVGVTELISQTKTISEYTQNNIEVYTFTTIIYLLFNLVLIYFMTWLEKKLRIKGQIEGGGA